MMDSLMTNNISRDVSLQEATLSSDRYVVGAKEKGHYLLVVIFLLSFFLEFQE